jgi:D-sedoheptulose 7-phosphate isomerase
MINNAPTIELELRIAQGLLQKCLDSKDFINSINEAAKIIVGSLQAGGKLIVCGNGGSMCDAMHFASELTGKYRNDRRPFPAIAISDPAYLTCAGNDMGYDYTFSRAVAALLKPEDTLFLITTSGKSPNVLKASLAGAIKHSTRIIALTGGNGITDKDADDAVACVISVPHVGYADRIQEMHIKIIHILCTLIEKELL